MSSSRSLPKLIEASQMLSTKFFPLAWREEWVSRPALVERIESGAGGALTLVSAPAGAGKSTLLAEWMHRRTEPVSWLSLDRSDNDPILFWAYLVAALQRFQDGIGDLALAMLHSMESLPMETILATLINDVAATGQEMVVVLDDYHVIESTAIHDDLSFFIERMPPNLHLILASRSEPSLPLARLRGQGRMVEIPASALRFSAEEAFSFLAEVMGLPVSRDMVARLEAQTEGWIAGLKLAALSIQGHQDLELFLDSFSGDHRFITDFLVEEVLQGLPEEVRDFLLQTAHLPQLCGALCDAVLDRNDSVRLLATLEQQNLFLIPLDDRRCWYRYHHLFGDVLASLLAREKPVLATALHRRAAAWFESEARIADAFRHRMAAGDLNVAADLVERSWRHMDRTFQAHSWLSWAEALPRELVDRRPVLCTGMAWALLDTLQFDRAVGWLEQAEALLESAGSDRMVVADDREFVTLPYTLLAARAYLAQYRGDVVATGTFARKALEGLPPDDHFYRAIPLVILGLAEWRQGHLEACWSSLSEALDLFMKAGNVIYAARALHAMAELRFCQGRLSEALDLFSRAADAASGKGISPIQRVGIRWGRAAVLLESGALTEAHDLVESQASSTDPLNESVRGAQVRADIRAFQGDIAGAVAILDEVLSKPGADRIPDWKPAAEQRTRWLIRSGRMEEAKTGLEGARVSLDDIPTFANSRALLALVHWHLVAGRGEDARVSALLDRLEQEANRSGRTADLIDVALLRARMALTSLGREEARTWVEQAMDLASRDGFLAPFLRERDVLKDFVPSLLARGDAGALPARILKMLQVDPVGEVPAARAGMDALSPREMEVLRLIEGGLRNQDIADALFISLATVKRHIANIYGKLGASHRTDALNRARESGLL